MLHPCENNYADAYTDYPSTGYLGVHERPLISDGNLREEMQSSAEGV